jgi:hypothetical protein
MLMITIMPFKTSASAYSGGFFDDGLYDGDWYFDYYELTADDGYCRSNQERLREYETRSNGMKRLKKAESLAVNRSST